MKEEIRLIITCSNQKCKEKKIDMIWVREALEGSKNYMSTCQKCGELSKVDLPEGYVLELNDANKKSLYRGKKK